MNKTLALTALVLLPLAATPALAAPLSPVSPVTPPAVTVAATVIDFEKNWDYLNGGVDGYYAGGTAADGTRGPNLGVAFVNVSGLSNDASFTYYGGAPSMQGVAYATAPGAMMNVAAGVASSITFAYASPTAVAGAIKAYSGVDGSGTLLGTFDLGADSSADYDHWSTVTFGYTGVARSFDLSGTGGVVAFDNIVLSPIPEPSNVALLLAGGAVVAGVARRRARR